MDAPGSVGNAAAEMQRGRVMAWLAQLPGQLLLALAQPRAPRTAALGLAGGFPPRHSSSGACRGGLPPSTAALGLAGGFSLGVALCNGAVAAPPGPAWGSSHSPASHRAASFSCFSA